MEIDALVARGLQILIALGGAYFLALWFVLVVWTFRDIEARSRSVVTQVLSTLLVVLFWIPGLALYWVLRPKETLDEAYQRSLEEEYLLQDLEEVPLCPTCQHFVEDDFQICPHCQTLLKDHCHHCDRLVDLRWPVCPYCGEQQHHHHEHEEAVKVAVPDDRWVDPAAIEERLRKQEELRTRTETRALPMATASLETVRDLLGGTSRRRQPETTVSTEPIPQPATHNGTEPQAVSVTTPPTEPAAARLDEASDPEQEAVLYGRPKLIEPATNGSGGTAAGGDATSLHTIPGATRDGDAPTDGAAVDSDEDAVSPNGVSPDVASKPGPTSVPRRFKVN